MYVILQSLGHSSCDNIIALLDAIFIRLIPETFSKRSSKISYYISEAVGPYFNTLNIEDVQKSSSQFTIHYNKQPTNR